MDKTRPEDIEQYLEKLGQGIHQRIRLHIAGAAALILPGYVSRHTEDIDVVGEVPAEIREKHKVLDDLEKLFGLHLGHVQSHYFPSGWENRVHFLARFGQIEVFLLDVYDVFLSKLFSSRLKDLGDLRVLAPQLEKNTMVTRLKDTATSFLAVQDLKQIANNNWKVLFGEDLPP